MKRAVSLLFSAYSMGLAANLVTSYGLIWLLLNSLSKTEYGEYGFLISLFSVFAIFFNFGHKELIFKTSSKEAWSPNLFLSIKSFAVFVSITLLFSSGLLIVSNVLGLVALSFALISVLNCIGAYFRGRGNYQIDAWLLPLHRAMWLGLLFLSFRWSLTDKIQLIFICSCLVSTILILPFIAKIYQRKECFSGPIKESLNGQRLKVLFYFVTIELASVFYLKSDVLLLRYFAVDTEKIAEYFFLIQIFEIAVMFLAPIGYFYFNGMSDKTKNDFSKYLMLLLALVFSGHILLFLVGVDILELVAPAYVTSHPELLLMCFSLYPVALNILLSSRLIYLNCEAWYAKICTFAFLINLLLNLQFIPSYGTLGALYIKILTEVLISCFLLFSLFYLRKVHS